MSEFERTVVRLGFMVCLHAAVAGAAGVNERAMVAVGGDRRVQWARYVFMHAVVSEGGSRESELAAYLGWDRLTYKRQRARAAAFIASDGADGGVVALSFGFDVRAIGGRAWRELSKMGIDWGGWLGERGAETYQYSGDYAEAREGRLRMGYRDKRTILRRVAKECYEVGADGLAVKRGSGRLGRGGYVPTGGPFRGRKKGERA